ncbi:MAG: hypothetical protein OXG44_02720 [Gammaproteobacteria bacterium]|nr:hypothetical protein [Gammaproteobacteria bacterium]
MPYYQVLAGGFAARFRRDYEWPTSIDTETANAECGGYVDGVLVHSCLYVPYPEFDEEGSVGFVVQPGMGVDVDVWRRLTLRLAADLPNPGERRLRRPPAETLRPRRCRAGVLTPRDTAPCRSDHEPIGERWHKVLGVNGANLPACAYRPVIRPNRP